MTPRLAHLHGRPLHPRELQILVLAAQGRTNEAIGHHLGISPETVRSRLRNAFAKLGAQSRAHAVHLAHDQITAQEATRV